MGGLDRFGRLEVDPLRNKRPVFGWCLLSPLVNLVRTQLHYWNLELLSRSSDGEHA
jgi:hypothetical protein